MDLSGFVTSLLISLIIFVVLVLIFCLLSRRPGNFVIYYPNRIVQGVALPEAAEKRSPFTWMKEAWSAKEKHIIAMAGLDATVYVLFLRTMFFILGAAVLFCLPILIPISGTDHDYKNQKEKNVKAPVYSDLDLVTMGNVTQNSNRLWAFLLGIYWVSLVTYYALWKAYKHVLELRAYELSSMKSRPEQFAVLVRDIPCPASGKYKEFVDDFFRHVHPGTFKECMVSVNLRKVSKIWKKLQKLNRKLAHAEAVYELSKTSEKPEGTRPQHKSGMLALLGPKVDSISFYNEKIKEMTPKLEEEQRVALAERQQGAAFIFFNDRSEAALAAQSMHGKYANEWVVCSAPEPREVVWSNLSIPLKKRMLREYIVYFLVFLTIVFYMIPISFISSIISLDNLRKQFPFLKPIVDQIEVKTILQAFLPQVVLLVFLALLPMLLMKLSKMEGIPSRSHVVRATAGKYFYFNVFNVFLGVTIGGTLFNSLQSIINNPTSIVNLLGASLPPNATFFITFIALKFLVGYGLELSRILPLIIYHLKRKYLCKTEEELQEAWAPGGMNYATCVPSDILIATIALCYSVIAPVILVFAMIYFGLGWLVTRNQVLNVKVPSYESGGRMWPHMHTRILAALFVAQLTMIAYFGIKTFSFTPILIPLPVATLIFAIVCKKFFYPSFLASPLCITSKEAMEKPPLSEMVQAFTPTCLLLDPAKALFEDVEKGEGSTSALSPKPQPLNRPI